MSKEPSIEEAVDRARRVQEDRINSIRILAEARQGLADTREETATELAKLQASITERVGTAERADVKAYNAAVSAGWTPEELHKIGYAEPDKKKRIRHRATRRKAAPESPASVENDGGELGASSADTDQPVVA
ncbi:hypothetical protein [Propionibacterium sp.]|uniref:hypothetical protein n=1 Tax=Propionibacterium sp. TaxID=1977903 RepID=UPI0039E9AD98